MQKKHFLPVILGGVIVLSGGIYLIHLLKSKPAAKLPDSVDKSPASTPKQATTASVFPLKVGSKSDLVKQLQSLLGVTADGIFGPKTLAALTAQTQKTQIATQAEFNQVIASLEAKPVIAAGQSRGKLLISQYGSAPTSQMMAITTVTAPEVVADQSGALQPTGKAVKLVGGLKLAHADYVPLDITTAGYLLFKIASGALTGTYKVDASKMTIV